MLKLKQFQNVHSDFILGRVITAHAQKRLLTSFWR